MPRPARLACESHRIDVPQAPPKKPQGPSRPPSGQEQERGRGTSPLKVQGRSGDGDCGGAVAGVRDFSLILSGLGLRLLGAGAVSILLWLALWLVLG